MGVLRPMLIYFSIFIVLLIYYTFLIYILHQRTITRSPVYTTLVIRHDDNKYLSLPTEPHHGPTDFNL